MAGNETPGLVDVDPDTSPPLALYQSPWTVSLSAAFVFRGAGTYVIDDIDNAGVERGHEDGPYRMVRKEVLSKKGWTTCRPLGAFCPDGLLHANLSRADYTALDRAAGLAELARHRGSTVNALVRGSSTRHGMWSLAGPDRAITAVRCADAAPGLRDAIARHEEAVRRSLPRSRDHGPALRRLRYLMPDPDPGQGLLDYFSDCLRRGLALVGSDTPVLSAAHDLVAAKESALFARFAAGDPGVVEAYNAAAAIQRSRALGPDHAMPYYAVDLDTGARSPITADHRPAGRTIIAPKILVLEHAPNMVLPSNTAGRATIRAREHAYRHLGTGSSQVFFRANWLQALAAVDVEVAVDGPFRPLLDGWDRAPLRELATALDTHRSSGAGELDDVWTSWVVEQTLEDFHTWHYPLLCYAIGGDVWLDALKANSYVRYPD